MLILKGIALGVAMFFVFLVLCFLALAWPNAQIDPVSLKNALVSNPGFWVRFGLMLGLMLALGCVIVRLWQVPVKDKSQ